MSKKITFKGEVEAIPVGKIIKFSDVIKNGGRLDADFYIKNNIGEDI